MSNTPRVPDDARHERRHQNEDEIRKERPEREGDPKERERLLEEKPFDFIERTRPEDRLDERGGQQTRDNVNPNIPSVEPEETGPPTRRIPNPGGIVDPNTLGMDQSQQGVAPPPAENQPEQRQQQLPEGVTPTDLANHLPSINEPPGSDIYAGDAGPITPPDGGSERPSISLKNIDPDSMAIDSALADFTLTVTGDGFTEECVVLVDDEEVPTQFISATEMAASVPMATAPDMVDVEVQLGEELSDVLSFEFLPAEGGTRSRSAPERKPKKAEPSHKRTKKSKR